MIIIDTALLNAQIHYLPILIIWHVLVCVQTFFMLIILLENVFSIAPSQHLSIEIPRDANLNALESILMEMKYQVFVFKNVSLTN